MIMAGAMTDGSPVDRSSTLGHATCEVGTTRDARRLDGWLLALKARGIPALLQRGDGAITLHVLPMHREAALLELEAMDAEEQESHRNAAYDLTSDSTRVHSRLAPVGGALFALLLVGFYLVTGPSASRSVWFGAGASDAARVVAGEWWRTITALTLHADSNHVLANIAIGTIVVTMVMRRTGVGVGAALVVLAGALGNAVNAWGYGVHHSSIGFSTAVFGAIGILGGLTYAEAVRRGARGMRRGRPAWAAIAGTIALLAMLGASEQSDMLAHLFGTFTGLAVGLIVGLPRWSQGTWRSQALAGATTIGVVLGAWGVALTMS
jgi:membrane associated rhomboid family serine protease